MEVKNLEKKADNQEQYPCRNCLLIHGMTETKTEDTDEIVLDVINNNIKIEMSQKVLTGVTGWGNGKVLVRRTSCYCKVYTI